MHASQRLNILQHEFVGDFLQYILITVQAALINILNSTATVRIINSLTRLKFREAVPSKIQKFE